MNDESQQIFRKFFDRIIVALTLVSFAAGGVVLFTFGVASPWFALSASLLVMTVTAFVIRLVGRLVTASYVLVLELIGLVAAVIFRAGTLDSVVAFAFVPIVIIAGMLLPPRVTLAIGAALVTLPFAYLAGTNQFSTASFISLLPPMAVTVLVAALVAQVKHSLLLLGDRLGQNRALLRERALELMQRTKDAELLGLEKAQLQVELKNAQSAANRLKSTVSGSSQVYALVQGSINELNQSLAILEQSIEAIGDMPTLNGYTETLEKAWHQLQRLKALVINLEEMVQVDRDEFELSLETVDISQLVREVAGTARGLAREKTVQIRHSVADDVPAITADPARLRQILLHVVSNAVKFTDNGFIEIRAEVDQGQLVIFVSDTGIGMLPSEAEQVFEKFGRASNKTARERQGAGLGLAISKRLIELHGGRMWVSSVLGEGSTFYIALPLSMASRPATAPVYSTAKSTLRLDAVKGASATQTRASVPLPQSTPAGDGGATMLSRQPVRHGANAGNTVVMTAAQELNAAITQPLPRRAAGGRWSPRATQPIHRYQPMYIKRFGYILLGLLFLVLVGVAAVAVVNYSTGNLPAALLDTNDMAQLPVSSLTPTQAAALPNPATSTPLPSTSTPPSPTALPTNSATPPPTPTTGSVAMAQPTATLVPPTSTPTPRPTASPTNVPAATLTPPLPTSTPLPTFTPSAVFVVVPTSVPTFAPGSGAAFSLPGLGDSRVSQSAASGQVVFTGKQANQRDIFVAAPNGEAQTNLTANSPGDDLQPDWSPDGQKIIFSSGRTGSFNIFSMDADGSNVRQLTNSLGFDEWPVWSPDGSRVVFVSDRDGNEELYVMDADGSNQRRLTNHPASDWPAAWSPDGRWLVFASDRDGGWNLFVTSAQGSEAVRLTAAPGDERDPIWSPDGATIAFVHNGAGNFNIYTLPLPNGFISEVPPEQWTQVTDTPADERFPTWTQVP